MNRRYGVLDDAGVKLTTIEADPALIADPNWYPGFGAILVDEGEVQPDPPPPPIPKRPDTWDKIIPALKMPMEVGDVLDLNTLNVTKAADVKMDPILADPAVLIDPVVIAKP